MKFYREKGRKMKNIFDRMAPEELPVIPEGATGNMSFQTASQRQAEEAKKAEGAFDRLSSILFNGPQKVTDFKVTEGVGSSTRDMQAQAIIESMERMGLVKGGQLVNPN